MFNGPVDKALWITLPLALAMFAPYYVAFLAALPFVIATNKRVVRPWVPGAYLAFGLVIILVASNRHPALDPASGPVTPLIVIYCAAAATHTALLDSPSVTIGK
ncbi:hypothetical protein [Streptomyces sp. NPDC057702]|uniref:hypothetical protein n=1 Tax=unclassified Streptomyces TaxID=2593676 RepID=UPI0036BA29E2